jgi:TM2 domain-containing membrane protein YozV
MLLRSLFVFLSFFVFKSQLRSENLLDTEIILSDSGSVARLITCETVGTEITNGERPNPVLHLFKIRQKKNKKITAAILAFPFPFGIVGLHRIYLGTAPYVPVVYIGTLGGVLGILPFIDFCVIVLDKNVDRYIENKNVLMWVDEKKPAK